jgi:hypothetical protein
MSSLEGPFEEKEAKKDLPTEEEEEGRGGEKEGGGGRKLSFQVANTCSLRTDTKSSKRVGHSIALGRVILRSTMSRMSRAELLEFFLEEKGC